MRSTERKGYVYVLSNPGMPGLLKIGRSINGGKCRATEMDGTGVPFPFELEFECLFEDCVYAEAMVHEKLNSERVSGRREFFALDVFDAIVSILGVAADLLEHTISPADFVVCDAEMAWVAHKFDLCPPDPYRIVEFVSDQGWLEAIEAYKKRYPLRLVYSSPKKEPQAQGKA